MYGNDEILNVNHEADWTYIKKRKDKISSKNNINSADNQSGQKFGFEDQKNGKKEITSDGIEALKPFEI